MLHGTTFHVKHPNTQILRSPQGNRIGSDHAMCFATSKLEKISSPIIRPIFGASRGISDTTSFEIDRSRNHPVKSIRDLLGPSARSPKHWSNPWLPLARKPPCVGSTPPGLPPQCWLQNCDRNARETGSAADVRNGTGVRCRGARQRTEIRNSAESPFPRQARPTSGSFSRSSDPARCNARRGEPTWSSDRLSHRASSRSSTSANQAGTGMSSDSGAEA